MWRLTKSAKAMQVKADLGMGMEDICDVSLLEQRLKLFQLTSNLIDDALEIEDGTQFVDELLYSGQQKLCSMKKVSSVGEGSTIHGSGVHDHSLKEPFQVRAKGCGKRLHHKRDSIHNFYK
ncbi:hypothetical protein Dimus_016862 [Dionaea muscipula]